MFIVNTSSSFIWRYDDYQMRRGWYGDDAKLIFLHRLFGLCGRNCQNMDVMKIWWSSYMMLWWSSYEVKSRGREVGMGDAGLAVKIISAHVHTSSFGCLQSKSTDNQSWRLFCIFPSLICTLCGPCGPTEATLKHCSGAQSKLLHHIFSASVLQIG